MARYPVCVATLSLALVLGCGSGSSVESPSAGNADSSPSAQSGPSPADIVSHFLDEIRRGGEDSRAQSLLTQQAQSELARIGQTVQPLGSPDARFEVTRAESVPGEENAALVHSLWSEPLADGTLQDYQVVWAVERESEGWRISGLAIEIHAGQPPQIIDFENGALMSKLLASEEEEAAPAAETPAQAATNSAISR